jgi:predicted aspartyl protease
MGETVTRFKVFGARGSVELDALVDTGATFTKIPRSEAERVGIETKYDAEVELSDGRLVPRKLGLAEIQIADVRRPVLVAVGTDGEKPVVGYTTVENLGFKVNPITRRLERARPIEF